MKVMLIFGTRPEAIKLAPVIIALSNDPSFETIVVVTAQHRDLLDACLTSLASNLMWISILCALINLRLGGRAILSGLEPILALHKPDWVLVQGDTTTVMAAAIAAHYARI